MSPFATGFSKTVVISPKPADQGAVVTPVTLNVCRISSRWWVVVVLVKALLASNL